MQAAGQLCLLLLLMQSGCSRKYCVLSRNPKDGTVATILLGLGHQFFLERQCLVGRNRFPFVCVTLLFASQPLMYNEKAILYSVHVHTQYKGFTE